MNTSALNNYSNSQNCLGVEPRAAAQATKQNVGKALAEYTGGRQLGFNTLHRLQEDLAEIGKKVHSQYQLSFVLQRNKIPSITNSPSQ